MGRDLLKWTMRFFAVGFAIATALALLFFLDYRNFVSLGIQVSPAWGAVYLWFWPTSIMLIGVGEAPDSTWHSISTFYVISIVANGVVYAIIGLAAGIAVGLSRRVRRQVSGNHGK